jgi:hypothetical protein
VFALRGVELGDGVVAEQKRKFSTRHFRPKRATRNPPRWRRKDGGLGRGTKVGKMPTLMGSPDG